MWRNLYCNKNQAQRDIQKQQKYRNPPPIIRQNPRGGSRGHRKPGKDALVAEVQPMIIPSQQQPMMNQMQQKMGNPYIGGGQSYIQSNARTPYIPMQQLSPQQEPLLDHNHAPVVGAFIGALPVAAAAPAEAAA